MSNIFARTKVERGVYCYETAIGKFFIERDYYYQDGEWTWNIKLNYDFRRIHASPTRKLAETWLNNQVEKMQEIVVRTLSNNATARVHEHITDTLHSV